MSTREVTPADIKAAYDRMVYPCVRNFNLHGELEPCMTGFALGEQPGMLLNETVPMPASAMKRIFSAPEEVRQRMVRGFVHQMLVDGSTLRENLPRFHLPAPSLVGLACEGWMASTTKDLRDEARRAGGVKNLPGSVECIMVFVYTKTDTFMGMLPVDGEPKRASYAPLPREQIEGRFHITGPMTTGPLDGLDDGRTDSWTTISKRQRS